MSIERSPGSRLTRRRLLQLSGLAGLALAGGAALFMWGGSERYRRLLPARAKRWVLSEKELAVLFVLLDRLFPEEPGWPSPREVRLAERIDKELSFHPPQMQRDVKAGLLLVEHGELLRFSGTPFTRLPPAEQYARLDRMALGTSLERQAFSGLKLMAHFFYYCDEGTWTSIHYEGPLVQVASPPEADSRLVPRRS